MASLRKTFETDSSLENDGVWQRFGDDFQIKLSRYTNTNQKLVQATEKITKPIRKQLQLGAMSDDEARKVEIEIFCRGIIRGWQTKVGDVWVDGINFEGDDLLPSNEDNYILVLSALPDLFKALSEYARDMAVYRKHQLEEEAKN